MTRINLKLIYSEMKQTWKSKGLKGLYKRYGLKLFLIFFVYYLIRDITLYIFIPWYIAQRVLN